MLLLGSICVTAMAQSRWTLQDKGCIQWNVVPGQVHSDHIEMSGLRVSTVVRYGVDEKGAFTLNRGMVWPLLRTIPNDTHASLMRKMGWNPLDCLQIKRSTISEQVNSISLDGTMTVKSTLTTRYGPCSLTRTLFPSTTQPAFCEKYVLVSRAENPFDVELDNVRYSSQTPAEKGVKGSYTLLQTLQGPGYTQLAPGDSLCFYVVTAAYDSDQQEVVCNVEQELRARKALVAAWQQNLVLVTPNDTINNLFAFAKIRAAESIYRTACGLLHGPGGESYYAAIWANDQAEYVNPFFPYLGYDIGNESALTAYRQFARFMNPDYKPIPSSIIAEGKDIWDGAGDRGDAAMIAYGAARYALSQGSREEALELWPLIEWCLEYCHRKLNVQGVVTSDSDELEGRFPSGEANLCTSSLYYDALQSAVYLGKALKKPQSQMNTYKRQAKDLRRNIDSYFGATVEGFDTYQYYQGNEVLRSWICMPLTVSIYDRKDETIRALFSPRLWTENGLLTQAGSNTFWDRSTLYALRGVFACGEADLGARYLAFYSAQRLLGEHVPYPIEAWPEGNQRHLSAESALYCRIITEGLFGIRPTGLDTFTCTPSMPAAWDKMELKHIKAFGADTDISVVRNGEKIDVIITRREKP